jgi:Dolichyl-phosphate-mannose-protein mannosyltransferase
VNHEPAIPGRTHWPFLVVLGAFGVIAFALPTLTDSSLLDDFVYAKAARHFAQAHAIRIPGNSAVNAIFEAVWGGTFSAVFGFSHGILRVSTLVLTALGAVAIYALGLEMGAQPSRAALGVAAYLFNPIGFVLSFSFMTDSHVAALTAIAAVFYVRGFRRDRLADLVAGSFVASLAFLSRNTGLAVALGALGYAVFHRRWRQAAASAFAPVVVTIVTLLWFVDVHGMPEHQLGRTVLILRGLRGIGQDWEVAKVFVFLALVYVAFATLPLLVSGALHRPRGAFGLLTAAILGLLLVNGVIGRFAPPAMMPYTDDWLTPKWLGPTFVSGADIAMRSPMFPAWLWGIVTVACLVGAVILIMAVCSARGPLGWMLAAATLTLAPSGFVFFPPKDRYFLPMVILAIPIVVAATRDRRTWAGWAIVGLLGAFSIVGTRDFLTLNGRIFEVARGAQPACRARLDQIDAGWTWDGWHFLDVPYAGPVHTGNTSWWMPVAPQIDSTYIVGVSPVDGYRVVNRTPINLWLGSERFVLLSKKNVTLPDPC